MRSRRVWQELKMLEQWEAGLTSVLLAHCQARPSLAPCSRARRASQWSNISTADLGRERNEEKYREHSSVFRLSYEQYWGKIYVYCPGI